MMTQKMRLKKKRDQCERVSERTVKSQEGGISRAEEGEAAERKA